MTRVIFFSVLLAGLALTGCKDSNDVASGDTFPENMQGVWQSISYSETGSDGSTFESSFEEDGDVLGIYFTEDRIGFWDYDGDEFDQGEDCYFADTAAVLISFEGSTFRVTDLFEGARGEFNINVEGSEMTLTGTDEFDGVTYDYSETFSRYDKTISQLTPKCEGGFKISARDSKLNTSHRFLR